MRLTQQREENRTRKRISTYPTKKTRFRNPLHARTTIIKTPMIESITLINDGVEVSSTGSHLRSLANTAAPQDQLPDVQTSTTTPQKVDISSIIFLLGVLFFIFIFSVIKYWLCEGPLAERQRRRARARRKQFIQERVVSKTVIRKQTDHHQDDNDTGEEGGEIFSRDDTKKTHTFDHSENEDHNADEGFIYRRQKTNLEVLSTSQHNLDEEADSSRLECQICLADFQVGDKICWSNNPACFHTFHIACLEPWLMKHDECPVCRSPYLVRPKEPPVDTLDNEEAQTIRGPMSPITRRVVAALTLPFSHRDDQHEPETNRNDPLRRRRDRDEGEGGSPFPLENLAAEAWSHGRNNRDAAFEALPSSSLGSPEGFAVVTPSHEAQSCFVDIDLDVESGNAER